jgi:two-component system heavy metal sensor histidine kinase CusS
LRARLALFFAGAVAIAVLAFGGAVVAVLAVAEQAEGVVAELEFREDAQRVLWAMALVLPFAVGGAAALGLLLAKRAVAPLQEASARARAARASQLDLTLPLSGTGDEWDELATTLNGLLADGKQSLERIRRFTADAAHELRTPLTAILGEADVALRRERTNEELRASLSVVREGAAELARVLDALLALARADAGALLARQSPVMIEEVVREAARTALEELAREAPPGAGPPSGQCEVSVLGEVPPVRGDRLLLLRAVSNVIGNGLRHGGGRVEATVSTEGARARVRILDRGPGVPLSLQPSLFQRFARADESRSTSGLGLGLSLARAITEAHGGTLTLLPSPSGALFELSLPACAGAAT